MEAAPLTIEFDSDTSDDDQAETRARLKQVRLCGFSLCFVFFFFFFFFLFFFFFFLKFF
jgi:hypothetical protein